jgi:hypothetical protein
MSSTFLLTSHNFFNVKLRQSAFLTSNTTLNAITCKIKNSTDIHSGIVSGLFLVARKHEALNENPN